MKWSGRLYPGTLLMLAEDISLMAELSLLNVKTFTVIPIPGKLVITITNISKVNVDIMVF